LLDCFLAEAISAATEQYRVNTASSTTASLLGPIILGNSFLEPSHWQ
jgi:hypothetical protein